jgi:hypothetical protein
MYNYSVAVDSDSDSRKKLEERQNLRLKPGFKFSYGVNSVALE